MRIIWRRAALNDLREMRVYIAEDNPQAANEMAARLLQAVATLQTTPSMGRTGRIPGTRELVVPGTPYILPYRVTENRIEILRVMHGARKWPSTIR